MKGSETTYRGAVTDEKTIKLVLRCLFEDGRTVWIVQLEIVTILWEGKVCGFVSTVVDLVRELLDSEGSGI
jgi:hypothetical protein